MDCRTERCNRYIEAGWKFCPGCGRRTGWLELDSGQPTSRQSFIRDANNATTRVNPYVVFRNVGESAVAIKSCKVIVGGMGIPCNTPPGTRVQPNASHRVEFSLDIPSRSSDAVDVIVKLVTDDGDRGLFPAWDDACERNWDVVTSVKISEPGGVSIYPSAVCFSPANPIATLVLANTGDTPATVNHIGPQSICVKDAIGAPVSFPLEVRPGQTVVTLQASGDVTKLDGQSLRVNVNGSSSHQVPIIAALPRDISFVPRYIVGIDFGTANTSIAVSKTDGATSEVVLIPDKSGETRFPSTMFVHFAKHGARREYGASAERLATVVGKDEGFLVEELKTELRSTGDRFAENYGAQYSKHQLARWYFSHLKSLIDAYFLRSYGSKPDTEVDVLYYVSLPVLNHGSDNEGSGHSQYQAQLEATRLAMEGDPDDPNDNGAGFPKGRIKYVMEPSSAALFSFHKLKEQGRFHITGNNKLCVFDSGGGTTDICVMEVQLERAGAPKFAVLGVCGEDERGMQFGGTDVTEALARLIEQKYENEDIYQSEFKHLANYYTNRIKESLTGKLADGERSVDFEEVIGRCRGFSLSEEEEELTLAGPTKPVFAAMDRMFQSMAVNRSEVDYAIAVGGNSMVPVIRKQLYAFFEGDLSDHVLPRLCLDTNSDSGAQSKTYIGSSEEAKAISEAVVRGNVLWYGAKLTKQLPFSIALEIEGRGRWETVAHRNTAFRLRQLRIDSQPGLEASFNLILRDIERKTALTAGCRIAKFALPATDRRGWDIDIEMDKDYRLYVYANDGTGRNQILNTSLAAAIDALSDTAS